jgi:hypothetical protein
VSSFLDAVKWVISETTRFISPPPVAMEWVLAGLAALLIGMVPFGTKLRRARAIFHRLANRRRTAVVISGLLPVALRLAMLGGVPVPEPSIHDEFSHLLLGDTLAHGRLANPPHPLWKHFESIHIIQQPTYSSMYPPAQGIFLALGEVLFHEPWAGVVISVGLMSMAVCWMLQGWLPPAWAFYGSLIAALKIGVVGMWMNTYMGGAAAAIGGALLIGSLPRLRREVSHRLPAIFLGLGMVILMNSRPFDGALLSMVALLYLARSSSPTVKSHVGNLQSGSPTVKSHVGNLQSGSPTVKSHVGNLQSGSPTVESHVGNLQSGSPTVRSITRLLWGSQSWPQPPDFSQPFRRPALHLLTKLAPAAIVLACGVLFTGYYNWRVTGSPTRMGYQVNRDTYGWPENLAFLAPKKLTLRDPVMQSMYRKEIARREVYHQPVKLLDDYLTRLLDTWTYFIGPVLTVPLLFLPWILRDRRIRPLVFFAGVIAVLNLFQLVLYPYHLAPLVAVIFAIVTQGVRHLYVRLGHTRGALLAIMLPVCLIAVAAMKQEAGDLNLQLSYWERAIEWHHDARAYIAQWLSRRKGKQLVVVRYSPKHEVNQEWVYNGADIDGSKIVWAREVDPESDAAMLRYFHDREVWLLEADVYPQRVVRYPATADNYLTEAHNASGAGSKSRAAVKLKYARGLQDAARTSEP